MNTRFCPTCRRNFGTLERCPTDGTPLQRLPNAYPAPGTLIDGEYELLAAMAAGGMSRIYRATSRKTSKPVAVKVLDPRMAAHQYTVERFYREARVSLLLDHPNVLDIYGFGPTADGHHVIIMELLGGESVGSLIRRVGAVPWEQALHVTIELSDALGHAHGRRVIHRDIKPDNVQLTGASGADERVKLMDFGIAYVSADSSFTQPAPGSTNVSGTPAYMSPEQIRGAPLDGRSDIYSLGCLLFEMLTGKRPFPGEDPIEVCRNQLYDRAPALADALPPGAEVPQELHNLVREMLAKSRRSRVPSVGALMSRTMALLPQERWPTRIRRLRRVAQPSGPKIRQPSGTLLRRPTGEFLRLPPSMPVTVLTVRVEATGPREPGPSAWPQEVDEVVAGWRALIEESGGLVQQPEPESLRCIWGLFRPSRRASDLWEAVLHAVRLRELCDEHFVRPGLELVLRGCVVAAETPDGAEPAVDAEGGVSASDLAIANTLVRAAPAGGVVADAQTRDRMDEYATFAELEPVALIGAPDEKVRVFGITGRRSA